MHREGMCRSCGFRKPYAQDAIWCEECVAEKRGAGGRSNTRVSTLAVAAKADQSTGITVTLAVFGILTILFLIGKCTGSSDAPSAGYGGVANSDRAAYEALRDRGYSDQQAKEAAPAIRRLCETGGGQACR